MSDLNPILPTHLCTWTRWGLSANYCTMTGNSAQPGSVAWGAANGAVYTPFFVRQPFVVRRMFFVTGTAAGGNFDIGLYTIGGAQLWANGSAAASGNGAPFYVTPSAEILLAPGPYFVALALDSTTANRVQGLAPTVAQGRALGVYTQATALPLPSSATFSAFATSAIVPTVGFTSTTSGF